MGYDVHITRAELWADNKGREISGEEWLALVSNDLELVREPKNGNYFVIWRGCPEHEEHWFDWFQGDVRTKYPDKPMLRKMVQMAKKLDARVQGDEGEFYTTENVQDSLLDRFKRLIQQGRKE